MKLSVYFSPRAVSQSLVSGKPVLVIDILRANTTMVTALANGARSVIPAAAADEAIVLAQSLESDATVLVGEQRTERIEGFAFGNSPLEMTEDAVKGKTLVMATTNGTGAYGAVGSGGPIFVGAAVNFTAAASMARDVFEAAEEFVIVCAGREGMFALEDAYTAGRYAQFLAAGRGRNAVEFNDGAIAARELVRRYGDRWQRAIAASAAAKVLKQNGYKADVDAATAADKYDVVPVYSNKLISIEN